MLRIVVLYVLAVLVAGVAAVWLFLEFAPFARAAERGDGAAAPGVLGVALRDPAGRAFAPSPLPLSLPIDCAPGVDCWILRYVDVDPGPGQADFACGAMSGDGHKGTDFALAHDGRLLDRVAVLAAADGTVAGTRDGVGDANVRRAGHAAVRGRECGNGVSIDHGGGWRTRYCHMKRGSVRVRPGDRVRAGDPLGAVGLSGLTEFPHVHMSVEFEGRTVDPFAGLSGGPACDYGDAPLWRPETLARLPYLSAIPYNIGFAGHMPGTDTIRSGALSEAVLPSSADILAFWAEVAGVEAGDVVALALRAPDGTVLAQKEETIPRRRIRLWRSIGKRKSETWPAGTYLGEVRIRRQTPAGPRESRREARLEVF